MRKNLLKIPDDLLDRIATFGQDDVIVACVRQIRIADAAKYAHLGVTMDSAGTLALEPRFIPHPDTGRISRENVFGREEVRRDLPKVTRTVLGEAPDWHGSGTHTTMRSIKAFPVDFHPPRNIEMSATEIRVVDDVTHVKFTVEQVINRRTPNFERDLLFNLNLLQENVGAVNVFASDTSLEEFAAAVHVEWEILPSGSVDAVFERLDRRGVRFTTADRAVLQERLKALKNFHIQNFVLGTSGFSGYVGAKLRGDLVVFENIRYGNALYVMFEEWEDICKRSRLDLLAGPRDKFERIVHRKGWQDLLRDTISRRRR